MAVNVKTISITIASSKTPTCNACPPIELVDAAGTPIVFMTGKITLGFIT